MRYIGNGAVIPPDRGRALRAVARWRKQWDEQGFGMCSVVVRETGEYAGWVTLAVPARNPACPSRCTRSPARVAPSGTRRGLSLTVRNGNETIVPDRSLNSSLR